MSLFSPTCSLKLNAFSSAATVVYHAFSGLCYLFPIFGAMLADQVRMAHSDTDGTNLVVTLADDFATKSYIWAFLKLSFLY